MAQVRRFALPLLLALWAGAMAWIPGVDFPWTVWLIEHRQAAFTRLMRRTLFEGDWPGGSDVTTLALLAVAALYVVAERRRGDPRWAAARPVLGYLLTAALAAGLGAVHAVKALVGRARPWDVLGAAHLPYSDWYQFGAHFVAEGSYWGSFPSGHTAAALLAMSGAYALLGDPLLGRSWRAAGWALGAFALVSGLAMTLANAMARSHWLSDGLGAAGLVWLLLHVLYHRVLRVAEQRRRAASGAAHAPGPWWEARLCGWGSLALAGAVAAALGLRALLAQGAPAWGLLAVPGVALLVLCGRRVLRVYAELHVALR